MKNLFISFLTLLGLVFLNSCEKVEQPVKPIIDLDTTLFIGGNWADYPWPTFPINTNTDRNVLIEDFTGHKCIACPSAAYIAKDIEEANPDHVFVVSIHAGPGGNNALQEPSSDCGTASNPEGEFCHDFITNEATEYSTRLSSFGFFANPQGIINRHIFNGDMFLTKTAWASSTDELLNENNLTVNMQAASNYYDGSGLYLHIQSEFKSDMTGNFNIVTYVIENQIIEWQDSANVLVEHYHHHNVFIGCIDSEAFGQNLVSNPESGDIIQTDYAYVLPTGLTNDSIHFISYVYDVDTYEVLQVIKHEF